MNKEEEKEEGGATMHLFCGLTQGLSWILFSIIIPFTFLLPFKVFIINVILFEMHGQKMGIRYIIHYSSPYELST